MRRLGGMLRTLGATAADEGFRRRYINVGHLLSGNAANLVLSLGTVALTARALGPSGYGILALVISSAAAIDAFVNFQTWQPLIRYGAELDDDRDRNTLMALFKFGFLLDFAAAAAGWLIAIVATLIAGAFYGWDGATYVVVFTYSLVLLFRINGTPVAILRLAGRFRSTAYLQVVNVGIRLALCAIAFILGGDILAFVVIWMVTQILGQLLMTAAALRELHGRGLLGLFRVPLGNMGERFPGIWRFTWSANFSLTLWSSAQQLDTLLVGALTDPASTGFYHIAKRVGRVVQQAGSQVQAVVYPEIARLWKAGAIEQFRKVVVQTELLLAAAGLALLGVMVFAAKPVVYAMAGSQFLAAAPLLVVQTFAVVLVLSGSVARSALLSMGRARALFGVVLLVILIFYLSAVLLIPRFGAMGANIAHVILGATWIFCLSLLFRRGLRSARGAPALRGSRCDQDVETDTLENGD